MLTRVYGTAFFSDKDLEAHLGAARAGARQRPPPARPRAAACSRSPSWRPGMPLWQPAGMAVWNAADRPVAHREPAARLPRGQDADPLRRRAVQGLGPLGQLPRQHVLHRRRGPADGPEADELPGPRPAVQGRRRGPTASCRSASPSRAWSTATSPAGRCTACMRVRHITQDDAHIFCTEEQIEDEVVGCLDFGFAIYERVRLRAAAGALDPAREAPRAPTRCGTTPRRRCRTRWTARAWSTRSTRATAPSTAPRSTCT